MRVVTSLLMLGLMSGVSANYASAQVHGAVEGVKVVVKSVDDVVMTAIKALHLESKVKTEAEKVAFAKKINIEDLKKLSSTEITKLIALDASYKTLRESYGVVAKTNIVTASKTNTDDFYGSLAKQGTEVGYNPSAEKTIKIWSEVLGMNTKHAEIFHSSLMQTPEGKASLTKIAAWEMAFTRNLGSDMDKASILKLIELETVAAAKHIQVTGSKVCDNLSGEGLAGFANYIEQVVKTAKVNMPAVELKNHMEDTYTKEFKRDGEKALKEVCSNCPGTIKC